MSSRLLKVLASGAKEGAYEIESSLMFNKPDDPYLVRTPSSNGNRDVWTFSCWYKPCVTSYAGYVFTAKNDPGTGSDPLFYIYHDAGNIMIYHGLPGANYYYKPNQKSRDIAGWYHIVVAWDTTQGTASNRVKMWITGEAVTSWHTYNDWPQNTDTNLNWTDANNVFGAAYGQNSAGEISGEQIGYIAEAYLLDGTVKAATDFGETNSTTGQWIPKETDFTSSEYGTNGFYLPFKKNDRYSPYFDGSTSAGIQTADSSDFTLGTNNFTVEAWVYSYEDQGQSRYIAGQSPSDGADANSAFGLFIDANNKPRSYVFYSGGNLDLISSTAIAENTWYHIALVRNSNTFTLYLDGTSVASTTSSITVRDSSAKLGVGMLGEYTTNMQFKGWISNFRFVNGSAVYTSNFTPSTSPLTAVTNTKLLCCQNSTITTDNSGTSKTITVVNTANTYSQQMAPFDYDWYDDHSGKDSHFQAQNITVNDIMLDSPTNNFPTLNFLDNGSNSTLSQGSLKATFSGWSDAFGTFQVPFTGKWYVELAVTTKGNNYFGLWTTNYTDTDASQDYGTGRYIVHHGGVTGGSSGGYMSAWSDGDIIGMAIDCDNGKLHWAKNGTYGSSGNPATGANPALTFTATDSYKILTAGASGNVASINFGQNGTFSGTKTAQGNADGGGIGDFYYAPPSGFKALCTKNLPTPAIKKSTDHFNLVLYTGNGSTQNITGVGFQPDLVWIKNRIAGDNHKWTDVVRGVTKEIESNSNDAEATNADGLTAFGSDGFSLGDDDEYNTNTENYVSWNWKANGSGSANNSGDINATVSANSTAGFSIVSWTGNGSNGDTVAHGLGKKPQAIFYKNRAATSGWYMVTEAIDGSQDYLALNSTTYAAASSWGAPTSSTISNWTWGANAIIAYVWAEIPGFSKIGSYKGNGNDNGPYVYTGFSPAWIMIKRTDSTSSWSIYDVKRGPINPADELVWADLADAEGTSTEYRLDILSNGFKLRDDGFNSQNINNGTFFYMAFAEFPFKYANAR